MRAVLFAVIPEVRRRGAGELSRCQVLAVACGPEQLAHACFQ